MSEKITADGLDVLEKAALDPRQAFLVTVTLIDKDKPDVEPIRRIYRGSRTQLLAELRRDLLFDGPTFYELSKNGLCEITANERIVRYEFKEVNLGRP